MTVELAIKVTLKLTKSVEQLVDWWGPTSTEQMLEGERERRRVSDEVPATEKSVF